MHRSTTPTSRVQKTIPATTPPPANGRRASFSPRAAPLAEAFATSPLARIVAVSVPKGRVALIVICGWFVWSNLTHGGRSIRSAFVVSDTPGEGWNVNSMAGEAILPEGEDDIHRARVDHRNRTVTIGARRISGKASLSSPKSAGGIDPYSLQKGIASFLQDHPRPSLESNGALWDLLEDYPPVATPALQPGTYYYQHDKLSSELVCGAGPGRGMEQDAGYKLLVEKIRISENKERLPTNAAASATATRKQPPKVLCLVYTYSPMRYLLRAQALLWGRHCDGFLAFSNETLPELGIYRLPPTNTEDQRSDHSSSSNNNKDNEEEESYNNMWQKTRKIWKHVHDNFLTSFDYFYLSGDDVYLLVHNLRAYLQELERTDALLDDSIPRHFGSWLPAKFMVAGGPGYVLNRAALQRYVGGTWNATANNHSDNDDDNDNRTQSVWSTCMANTHRPYEDRFLSTCLSRELGIWGNATDTRDPSTGEQRFHDTDPATLYLFRAASTETANQRSSSYFSRMAKAWEDQPMPVPGEHQPQHQQQPQPQHQSASLQQVVGPKHGLEAASKHSISLHRIFSPTYMARIHAILHPREGCPVDSPLGRGLQQHYVTEPEG